MRIVIDMQGAQTESRFRGIGRYTLSLALAIARNAGGHEIYLALNGLFPKTIEPIREAFRGPVPQENIRVWQAPGPLRWSEAENAPRRAIAERVREAFLEALVPDVVIVTSLFEGMGDDAAISIGTLGKPLPTAVIFYDLNPMLSPDEHFRTNPIYRAYYADRIGNLNRARHLLAISESARQEALSALPFTPEQITNVSGACDEMFTRVVPDADWLQSLKERLGLTKPFVMYTGGADARKNLPRLIEAFARLPEASRRGYQLLFVGRMPPSEVNALRAHAQGASLQANDLLFSDYINDEELLALFSTCSLFVFPSLHEGFGLPPLEAMACGAVVIAADSTSLPEVMGSAEALFDPHSVPSISAKIHQALTDEGLRTRLRDNARTRARAFSWDRSAILTLQALTMAFERTGEPQPARAVSVQRTTLFEPQIKKILLLKLDHMGDLLLAVPAIARLRARYPKANIDIAVGSWNQALAQTLPFFNRILTLDYFKHKSSLQAGLTDGSLREFLGQLDAYDLAVDLRRQPDTRFLLTRLDAVLKVGYSSLDPAIDAKLDVVLPTHPDVPFVETPLNRTSISEQMLALIDALPAHPSDYVVLPPVVMPPQKPARAVALFPYAGGDAKEWPTARFHELARRLAADPAVEQVSVFFANETEARRFSFDDLEKAVTHTGLSIPELMQRLADHQLCVANNSGGAHLAAYLGVTVLGIYGGHETATEWGPVFGNSYVVHRAAACSPCHIAARRNCRHQFFCLDDIAVAEVYNCCRELLASNGTALPLGDCATSIKRTRRKLFQALAPWVRQWNDVELSQLARGIALSLPGRTRRTLFVDVSGLVRYDARTGIQRVVRSVLSELLKAPPRGFEVWPVYATHDRSGYFYARDLRSRFLGQDDLETGDNDPIDFQAHDVFLGLDLNPGVKVQEPFLDEMHRFGVRILFVVYDLLCIQMPANFLPGSAEDFEQWLNTVSRYDGVVCGSQTVANDFTQWVRVHYPQRQGSIEVGRFCYGADVHSSRPSVGMPDDAPRVLKALRATPSFLMVGRLEPRKGHTQALAAFEELWQNGTAVNLVIVGKSGWLLDALIERLRAHPEQGKRLFWLEGISDEYLEQVYATCCCLLAASEGEGFALPLIEAAHKHLPILARDIPVFREIALDHAYYFRASSGAELAEAVTRWLALYRRGTHPKPEGMPTLTWQAAAHQLLNYVLPIPTCQSTNTIVNTGGHGAKCCSLNRGQP